MHLAPVPVSVSCLSARPTIDPGITHLQLIRYQSSINPSSTAEILSLSMRLYPSVNVNKAES